LSYLDSGLQNVLNVQGFTVSIVGMLIVFTALSFISIFIALLPKMLVVLAKVFPEEHHHAVQKKKTSDDDDKLLAAIGFGLLKIRAKEGIKE
jgi:Na+-transporting methylmalonyl-CoA/oxaloacetate decarboxylase gamma subunit